MARPVDLQSGTLPLRYGCYHLLEVESGQRSGYDDVVGVGVPAELMVIVRVFIQDTCPNLQVIIRTGRMVFDIHGQKLDPDLVTIGSLERETSLVIVMSLLVFCIVQ